MIAAPQGRQRALAPPADRQIPFPVPGNLPAGCLGGAVIDSGHPPRSGRAGSSSAAWAYSRCARSAEHDPGRGHPQGAAESVETDPCF